VTTPGPVRVVPATDAHIDGIAEIDQWAAMATHATFNDDSQDRDWWRNTVREADPHAGRVVLVALDKADEVIGYAMSGPYLPRPGYRTTCETTIYVTDEARGTGVGNTLYTELLRLLDASPLRLAVAGITEPNPASTRLHRRHGFVEVGTFREVGAKFGRFHDVTWYQRSLAVPPVVRELHRVCEGGRRDADAQAAVAVIRRMTGHRWVGVYDVGKDEVSVVAWDGPGPPAYPMFPTDRGLTATAITSRRTVVAGDVTADARYLEALPNTRAEIIVPVVDPDTLAVIGTLEVESEHADAFDAAAILLLEGCAHALLSLWRPLARHPWTGERGVET
jgi:phosphinothricin acetyltransferase